MEERASNRQEVDPRVRRTRQMFREALLVLLHEKDFGEISIQDVADKSTLNRGTFYDHYSDKAALLQDLVLQQFQDVLTKECVTYSGHCVEEVSALLMAVCKFLGELQSACPKHQRMMEPFVQSALQMKLQTILLDAVEDRRRINDDLKLAAASASWAMYGGARHWVDAHGMAKADAFARTFVEMLLPVLSRLTGRT